MKPKLTPQPSISHFMTYGGPEFIKMIQKNNIMTCVFLLVMGEGQELLGGGGFTCIYMTACI